MLTIFSTGKAFEGHFGLIQRNAIRSWRALSPAVEIILFDDSPGTAEIAAEVKARHVPEVRSTAKGVPYISDMFMQADKLARHGIVCFLNSDIILPGSFLDAVEQVKHMNRFLMVGHRYNMDFAEIIDFADESAVSAFWRRAKAESQQEAASAIDYFCYSKGVWRNLPDFVIGSPGYDNWLIWRARRSWVPVVDATALVQPVHQNHDYSHREGGLQDYKEGKDTRRNRELTGDRLFTLNDASHEITPEGVVRWRQDEAAVERFIGRIDIVYLEFSWLVRPIAMMVRRVRRWIKKRG